MIGEGWRYVYASSASGAFNIEVLEHDGNPVPLSTVSDVAGGEGPSPWLEIQGTLSIKVSAGDSVGHTVTVCGETAPSASNQSDLDSR